MVLETQHLETPLPQGSDDSDFGEHILPKGAVLQSRYEIIKVAGVGGMGAVYLAERADDALPS